ncbi:MAG: hypothetical protein JSU67_17725 [Gammaproteobacteria bacterium]|nr:MAG: hypothetical protein JSU67_17725 [Gammaproteobacteria bacterium]
MHYPEETEKKKKENTDMSEQQKLVLDGTANLDYSDDEQVPRVKGLIELLNQYFGKKSG